MYATINIGTIEFLAGTPGAVEKLERILDVAKRAGLEEHAGRGFVALTWWAIRFRSYAVADRYLDAGLDYCIERWDPDHKGALFEPHHNTYDIEFWGADGMCTSFYLVALRAAAIMGRVLGEDVSSY